MQLPTNRTAASSALLILGLLAGCVSGPPQTLENITVPADFTFAGTQPVQVSVTASASSVPASGAMLSLLNVDGKIIFQGAVRPDRPVSAKLAFPAADTSVTAVLQAKGMADQTARVAIKGGAAAVSF